MLTPFVRFIIVLVASAGGVYSLIHREWIGGGLLLLGAFLIALNYRRHGTVYLAFKAAQRGDSGKARVLIAATRRPEALSPQDRAYFHLMSALLAGEDGDREAAERELGSVQPEHLRTDNDRALVEYLKAELAFGAGDTAGAAAHLNTARAIPHRPQLDIGLNNLAERLAK